MAAVLSVTNIKPRDGKGQAVLASISTAKKILERLGGKVRILASAWGGNPMTVTIVVEHAGWAAFGAFGEKAEKDAEWQSHMASIRANPKADVIQTSVATEVG